jgi:hypothetical protein
VILRREDRKETAVVEIWDWLSDVGAAFRGFDGKLATAERGANGTVSGVMVLRATQRNRHLVHEFAALFRSHFPASSAGWLATLTGQSPMPNVPGLMWTNVTGTQLRIARVSPRA